MSSCFANDVNEWFKDNLELSFVYDNNHCYALSKTHHKILSSYTEENLSRSAIVNFDELNNLNFQTKSIVCSLSERLDINDIYEESRNLRATPSGIYLQVKYVTQRPYSNICWAASAASVGNYLMGEYYDAVTAAKHVKGTDFNQAGYYSDVRDILNQIYGTVSYNCSSLNVPPTDTRIYNNLKAGYPVIARWVVKSNGAHHQTVISGTTSGASLMIMDPEFGSVTAWKKSGIYSYVSAYSGNTLTLEGYMTHQ